METNKDKEAYDMAYAKVKRIKGFYTHLTVYIIVNAFIVVGNFNDLEPGESYFQFHNFITAFFWGMGLVAHGFSVFVPNYMFGKEWEDKKVKQFMDKDKNTNWE
jgi:2TM domain